MALLLQGTTAVPLPGSRKGLQRWRTATSCINMVTRITMVTYGKKFSASNVPYTITPVVQQESNAGEGLITTNRHAGSGAPFSSGKDKPHPKLYKITPTNNGPEEPSRVHHAWLWNFLLKVLQLTFLWEILRVADLLDQPAVVPITILVTVIVLAPESNGIKLIIDRLMQGSNYCKKLLLLLLFCAFVIRGANAQGNGEDGISKKADDWAFVVWTLLVGIITITVWIIRRVQAVPPPAVAPALALPAIAAALAPPAIAAPVLAPLAIAAPVLAPPAIAAPALAQAPAIAAPALAPPAIGGPAFAPPAIAGPALAPPAIAAAVALPAIAAVVARPAIAGPPLAPPAPGLAPPAPGLAPPAIAAPIPGLGYGAPRRSDSCFDLPDYFQGMEEYYPV